jgi:hypothetical protein
MPEGDLSDLIRREEGKRNKALDPVERWRLILAAIAWADAQQPVPRNSPARCLEIERRRLGRLGP